MIVAEMKRLHRKCCWFATIQLISITVVIKVFYYYACGIGFENFQPVLFCSIPEKVYYSPRPRVVNTWNENFLISGQNICRDSQPYLLLLFLSIPKSGDKRAAIRETWTRVNEWPDFKVKIAIKTVFLFGKYADERENDLIVKENDKYGDVIVGNFVDSYRNLTLKVLTGLYWVRRYCAGAKFVAKIDDDTFVNMPLLYKHLETIPQLNSPIFGYLITNSTPERNGKYYISYNAYPFNTYPPYTTGNMYIARPETFSAILDVAKNQPWLDMEDVFITGILAKIANVSHLAYPSGMYFPRKQAASCEFVKNTKLFSKDYSAKDVRNAWKIITEGRNKCL